MKAGVIFVCQALIDRFPALWGALKNEIKRLNVECEVIPGENPWIRDYMPVDVPDRGLFQFRYAPKYHADPQYRESEVVFVPEHLSRDCIKLNWVMDGGGLLVDDRVVLLSSKFPPPDPSMLDVFQGKHVLMIPVIPMTLRGTWMDCAAFMVGNFCTMITRKWTSRIGKRFLTK